MSHALKGEVAIITGAGRGIGREFALRFAEEGAKLLLPDISLEGAEGVAKEIRANGGEALAMEADISDEASTKMIAEKVTKQYGKVDILVNNAALYYGLGHKPWDSYTVEEWDRVFEVNVRGTWLCCKAIAPLMRQQSKGKIINISSSIIAPVPSAAELMLHYACSKAAVYTMTQALARALGGFGINVNAIAPGHTTTEDKIKMPNMDQKAFDYAVASQCIHRREEPKDLVGTAVFLASKDSDFITGQLIVVDGGSWLR